MAKARKTNPRKLKASFDAARAKGMRALRNHDFDSVNRAIERERELIERQKALISKTQSKLTKP